MTKVVHCKKASYDRYVGREDSEFHFGNPFSHQKGTKAHIVVKSRDEAVRLYKEWLLGNEYPDLCRNRRDWILNNVHKLKDKTIACWCKPLSCHGDVLAELADRHN